MRRRELDQLYSRYKQSTETHPVWLTDMVRILLQPTTFWKIFDVVHYPWVGDIGGAE